jgi:transcriptional regulator with XRE-family HTH domain
MKIGEKIKHLRVKNGLTQEELANRCELSKGFISQVERDLTSPSIATLIDILECLGTNLRDFFNHSIEEKVVIRKNDVFVKHDRELKHEIKWLVPNAQKNSMEPILMSLDVGGCSGEDDPHNGEEFGYVISGSVNVHLGNQKYKARKGESFYFMPSVVHSISNAGKNRATILWISSPPSF